MLLSLFYIQGIGGGFNQSRAEQKWWDWVWGLLPPCVLGSLTFKINNKRPSPRRWYIIPFSFKPNALPVAASEWFVKDLPG